MGKLCFLVALLLAPVVGYCQDTTSVDVDALVEELNAQCPIDYGENWGIGSFTMVDDRYALVDMLLPSSLSMFLSSLSSDEDKVKRLWINQFGQYGEQWNQFVDAMVEADRQIIVNLHPVKSNNTELISLSPSDFVKLRKKK